MSVRRFPVYVADERVGEVIRRVSLWSDTGRSRSSTDFHVIRAGISSDAGISYIGEWDQSRNALTARKAARITGPSDINRPLPLGCTVVCEVETTGSPETLDGLGVLFRFAFVGETQASAQHRPDGNFAHRHEITKPLFSVGRTIVDAPTREAVEAVASALNTTHLPSWTISVRLDDGA